MIARLFPSVYREFPLSVWIVVAVIFFSFVGLGVVLPVRILYAQQVGLTLIEIGVMASAFYFSQFIFQLPLGVLSDRIGRKWTLFAGLAIQAAAAGVYLVTDLPWIFILMRFIEGIGAATQQPAARALIADVVPEGQRGRAYGLYRAGFQGGLLAGPALGGLAAGAGGYEITYILNGLSRLVACILVVGWLKESTRPRSTPGPTSGGGLTGELASTGRLFSRPLVAAYSVAAGALAANGLDSSIWSIYLVDLGASLTLIGITFTIRAAAAVICGPIGGALADRYSRPLIVGLTGLLLTASSVVLAYVHNMAVILLASLAQGVGTGLVLPAVDRYLADHSPRWARARVQSIFQAVQGGSGGLIALAAGPLYEQASAWPFLMIALLNLLAVSGGGLAMYLALRGLERRQAAHSG